MLNVPAIVNVWNPRGPVLLWVASLSPHRHNHHHLHNHHHHVSIHAKCACHFQCLEPQGSCEWQASLLTDTITTIYTITTIMCQHMLNASAIINVWNPMGPVLLWVASLSPHRHNHHHLHNHHHHVSIHAKCACHQATDLTV